MADTDHTALVTELSAHLDVGCKCGLADSHLRPLVAVVESQSTALAAVRAVVDAMPHGDHCGTALSSEPCRCAIRRLRAALATPTQEGEG